MNPYLTKLRGLSKENLQVTEPSKPSKPSFDCFEDEQSSRVSGNEPVEFEQGYYRNALATLRSKCPELVESDRWQQAIHDANSFLHGAHKPTRSAGRSVSCLACRMCRTGPDQSTNAYPDTIRPDWCGRCRGGGCRD